MRLRTLGLAAALTASLSQTSDAVVQPKGHESNVVTPGKAARTHREITWSRASQLASVGLPGWTAMWDRDTDVPLRLWGPGIAAPNAVRDAIAAERVARQFLATHLALLAPGARASDFVVVSNELGGSGDIRSIGFAQHAGGVRVLGGAIGFSFKHDRLVMVGSTALPNVSIDQSPALVDGNRIAASAVGWLRSDGHAVRVTATDRTRVIVPLVRPRTTQGKDITYRIAERVTVEATTGVGLWDVWLDAFDASPIARKTKIHYASGRVLYDVPDRSPSGTRSPKPAPNAAHMVNGVAGMSALDGSVTWASGNATIIPSITGPLIAVSNRAGAAATDSLSLDDGGEVVWSKATEEFNDAQLSAFVFASQAKTFAKTRLNPNLAWLDGTLDVVVNENSSCNAYSTGDDIHFYRAKVSNSPVGGTSCQNTARLADVVYHEFGHSLHANSIIEGVGSFDGALSEGVSDMLAAFITKDHGMGRGFFFSDAPLRDLDPAIDKKWGEHTTGEVHDDGEIIGGTLWDLRKALVAKHGEAVGDDIGLKIFYGILQRATDIPSTYVEALVSDDDDGDLTNGTPNQCEINAAFGAHALADPRITLGLGAPVLDGRTITLATSPSPAASACPGPTVQSVVVDWKVRGGAPERLDLAASGSSYAVELPQQPAGTVVQYKVTVTLTDGMAISFPNNAADPFYEMYVGDVETIWCADFESGGDDWLTGASSARADEWEVGPPQGLGGDPKTAHGGTNVLGLDLTSDGLYRRNSTMWAESPEIDLAGNTNVRLQYYRWLGVEDGYFDNANILVNGTNVWSNYKSPVEPQASVNHTDREWRFQDIDVSHLTADGKLKIRFELATDPGFALGGWTMDDVCIVLAKPAPPCAEGGTCDGEDQMLDNGMCSTGSSSLGLLPLLGALGLVLRRRGR